MSQPIIILLWMAIVVLGMAIVGLGALLIGMILDLFLDVFKKRR